MQKLALIGPPGSGKSTIATAWLGIHEKAQETAKLSFAEFLRWELAEAFCVREQLDCKDLYFRLNDREQKQIWRPLLQTWGQTRRDVVDKDYWVNPVRDRFYYLLAKGYERVAVDDCRYPNEYEFLKTAGFTVVRLEQTAETLQQLSDAAAHHESETYWPHFGYDYFLTYEPGAQHQAKRIEEWFSKR